MCSLGEVMVSFGFWYGMKKDGAWKGACRVEDYHMIALFESHFKMDGHNGDDEVSL